MNTKKALAHDKQPSLLFLTEPLPLWKGMVWTFSGNVIYATCQWGMLVGLAKLGSPEMVGQFAFGLAITAPIVIFANLALRPVQATDARREYQFRDYLLVRLVTTLIACCIIAGIAFVGGYQWSTISVILAIGLSKAIESVSDIFYGLFQQHERMDYIAKSMIWRGLLSLVGLCVGVYLTGSVFWGVVALIVSWTAVLVTFDIPHGRSFLRNGYPLHSRENARESLEAQQWYQSALKLIKLALPLGLATMLHSLNTYIPRYFIEHQMGERELGFFAAVAYVAIAGSTVVNALGQAASPRLAKYFTAEQRRAFGGLLLKLVGASVLVGAAGTLVAALGGRWLLVLLYRAEYAEYVQVFVYLMMAGGIEYVAISLSYGMTAVHAYRIQPFIFALSSFLIVLLCILLVPTHGLLGAAWTLVITSCFKVAATLSVNIRALRRLEACVQ